jgi:hypothetical protein
MSFEHEGLAFDLLDTPPPDFSEDTYRTLTAVECGDGDSTPPKLPKKGARRVDPHTVRGLPAARRADLDLRQHARPRGREQFSSFIAMLTILKLPHSHVMFPGRAGF